MAKLYGDTLFTGSTGGSSAYKMKGVSGIILRSKGGASRQKIETSPSFERTRENNAEWGGCSKASKNIRLALSPLRHLADYNISGELNKITKILQKLDIVNNRGERGIQISRHCHSFEGFGLNRVPLLTG